MHWFMARLITRRGLRDQAESFLCRGSCAHQQAIFLPCVFDIDPRIPERHVVQLRAIPRRGKVGPEPERMMQRIPIQSEESAQGRRYNHRGRPDLVRAAASQRLVQITGQQLGHRSQILRPRESRVLHQVCVSR